jgi:hypothetical protein
MLCPSMSPGSWTLLLPTDLAQEHALKAHRIPAQGKRSAALGKGP